MKDLLDFLLAPVRRVPWLVAIVFGALLALDIVVDNVFTIPHIPHVFLLREGPGLAACFAAGLVGASRGREFDQGLAAVLAAIVIANLIGAWVSMARDPTSALDLPLPGMMLLGVPLGTVGAGIGTWLSHRHTVA